MTKLDNDDSTKDRSSGLLDERPYEEQLRLKDRALATCAEGVTIADATQPDCPLIYVNRGFEELTGYSAAETCGTNCRFLQGKDTDPAVVEEIRRAVKEKRGCVVEILNYRKSGEPFWNRLSITPIHDEQGTVTHFIGVQSDVTARRNAEDALRTANFGLEQANSIIRRDLEAAAKIQASFLPPEEPELQGVAAAWDLIPCDELAGDTLSVYRLNDRFSAFYVLDVSGHGVQAALLSATLNHWLSPETGKVNGESIAPGDSDGLRVPSPVEVLTQLNRQFPFDPLIGQYFTLVYGVLDSQTRTFRFVAAGHPSPIYVPVEGDPQIQRLDNFPIGIVADPSYEEITIKMNPGDRVYLYSDGLLDVTNASGEQLGEKRLAEELGKVCSTSLKTGLSSLIDRLHEWSGEDSFQDDVSILGFEIK
jgi:PAS domain S-box-containing protein